MKGTGDGAYACCVAKRPAAIQCIELKTQKIRHSTIGGDLSGLLGGRMASAEGGSVSSGVAYGEGCPLSSQLRGLGERRELPRRSPSGVENCDFGVF